MPRTYFRDLKHFLDAVTDYDTKLMGWGDENVPYMEAGRLYLPSAAFAVNHLYIGSDGSYNAGGSDGQLPIDGTVVEASAVAILAALNKQIDRVETVLETVVTTDAGGGSTDELVPAPAAGFHLVITGIRLLGVNLAVMSTSFDTVPASVLKGDRIAAGRSSSIINAPLATVTAFNSTITGGGNTVKYTIEITYAIEAD